MDTVVILRLYNSKHDFNWPSGCVNNTLIANLAKRLNVNHDLLWLPKVIVSLGKIYQARIMTLVSTVIETVFPHINTVKPV